MNGSAIPAQEPTLDVKLAVRGYRIDLHRHFARASLSQADGRESCIMVESRPTRSLIAKFLQRSSLATCEFRAASEEH